MEIKSNENYEKTVKFSKPQNKQFNKNCVPFYGIKNKSTMHSVLQYKIPVFCHNKLITSTVFSPNHKIKTFTINLSNGNCVKKQDELS